MGRPSRLFKRLTAERRAFKLDEPVMDIFTTLLGQLEGSRHSDRKAKYRSQLTNLVRSLVQDGRRALSSGDEVRELEGFLENKRRKCTELSEQVREAQGALQDTKDFLKSTGGLSKSERYLSKSTVTFDVTVSVISNKHLYEFDIVFNFR